MNTNVCIILDLYTSNNVDTVSQRKKYYLDSLKINSYVVP